MMRKGFLICLILATVLNLMLFGTTFAEEMAEGEETEKVESKLDIKDLEVTAGTTLDIYGKYIWRGQTLVDDPVFQSGAYISAGGFTASIWGNYSFEDDDEDWTEVDYALDYTTSLECIKPELEIVSLSVGYIYYDFPNLSAGDDSQEAYGAIALDTILAPAFAVYHDWDEGDGTYYEISAGHSIPVDKLFRDATLNLSAAVGYNDDQWDFDSSWSAALFGASITIPLTDRVTLEPGIFYSAALDSQYDDEVYAGFSLGVDLWN